MIRLMFQRPELPPALSVFTEDVVVVGRGGAAGAVPDWVLPFADVSRLQCRFTMGGDTVFVEGLSERNATFVNNGKISAITRMHPGDVVRFGACIIRFVGTTPEGDVAARPEPVQAPVAALVPARVAPRPAPMPTPAAPRVEVGPAGSEEPVPEDMSPILEHARRWELHGQVPELLLRGDALRRGLVWLRRGAALPAGGVLVRRFVETSARRRRQRWVGGFQACGLVLATLLGGHATASWIYPELVGPKVEPPPPPGSVCDQGVLARADRIVAAAGQEVDGASALLGLGYALQVAEVGGCRALSKAEPALRLRLAGQRARVLGQVEGPVQALVLRPDGRLAAVADAQGGLSIVDMHGQTPQMHPADASGPVAQMAWSADRRWLATGGSDSEVLLWDVDLERISRHQALDLDGEATALAFSPDGAVLATGEKGGTLRLWDIGGEASGRRLDEKKGLPGAPSQLVFDAAGMRLYGLVGSRVWVWSLTSTGEGRRFANSVQLESELSVTAMAVDLGGHRIVTGDTVGQVLLWKQAGGRWKERQLAMHDEAVVQVQIVPERDVVISTADRSIKLVELSTRGKKGGMPFPQAMTASEAALHIVIDAAGRRMLTVGASEPPELWDLAARRLEPLARLSEQRAPVRTVALAETQALVVTGDEGGTLRAWDLMVDGGSAGAHVIGDHKTAIEAVGLSRSGSTLASAGRDGQLRVWKIDEHGTPERLAVRSPGSPLQQLALSQDGRWIAGAAKNLIHVWDTRSQDGEAHIALPGHEEDIAYLAFSTGGDRLVTVDRHGVVLTWQMAAGGPAGEPSRRVELGSQVAALVVSSERVAVGTVGVGQKGRVHAWALADTVVQPPSVWEHSDSVSALVMSEDGKQLASGSQDGSVTVGEWRNGRFERTENSYNLGVRIEALAMVAGPDGVALAIGGASGEVAVRELSRVGEQRRFRAHEGQVRGLAFVGTERELLTAGQDGALKWWHLEGDAEPRAMALTGHTGAIRELLVDAGGQIAVSMGVDQTLRVWPLTTQGLLQLACRAAGRNLTGDERERLLVDPAPLCGLRE